MHTQLASVLVLDSIHRDWSRLNGPFAVVREVKRPVNKRINSPPINKENNNKRQRREKKKK